VFKSINMQGGAFRARCFQIGNSIKRICFQHTKIYEFNIFLNLPRPFGKVFAFIKAEPKPKFHLFSSLAADRK
jgi:hypothetical protein